MGRQGPTIIGLGAGGHARVMIDLIRRVGGYDVHSLLDANRALWDSRVLGVPVLGDDRLLSSLYFEHGIYYAFVGVGSVKDTALRQLLFARLMSVGFRLPALIDPTAFVSQSTIFGFGVCILPHAVVQSGVSIFENVLINTGAIVEHDCVIGAHTHIASGAMLAGEVHVDGGAHIGLGACIKQGVRIGKNVCVGAGAVVVKDVPDGVTVVGVPARIMENKHATR